MDALVESGGAGFAKFKCLHPLPLACSVESSSWKITNCGPFVTSKTMIDAVVDFAFAASGGESESDGECCEIASLLLGIPQNQDPESGDGRPGLFLDDSEIEPGTGESPKLNKIQNTAVLASLKNPLTCLWGPPGTGKTQTIVEIIRAMQEHHPKARILVTAPTHNATDNVMRRYLEVQNEVGKDIKDAQKPLRVSTEVSLEEQHNRLDGGLSTKKHPPLRSVK